MTDDKKASDAKLRVIFDETFNVKNDASIAVLQLIKALAGFDQPNVRLNEHGDIADKVNIYNEGRRSLYLDIRRHLTNDVLHEVEIKRRKEHGDN